MVTCENVVRPGCEILMAESVGCNITDVNVHHVQALSWVTFYVIVRIVECDQLKMEAC